MTRKRVIKYRDGVETKFMSRIEWIGFRPPTNLDWGFVTVVTEDLTDHGYAISLIIRGRSADIEFEPPISFSRLIKDCLIDIESFAQNHTEFSMSFVYDQILHSEAAMSITKRDDGSAHVKLDFRNRFFECNIPKDIVNQLFH